MRLSAGNECSGVEPSVSQTGEDCTQIAEVDFETFVLLHHLSKIPS